MTFVLDTDILSLLAHKDSPEAPRVHRRIAELPSSDDVATTVVNYEEQMRGWMAALSRAKNAAIEISYYARLVGHLATFRKLPIPNFDEHAAATRESLRKQKVRIGTMDLKIASIVLAAGAVLITRNIVDFRQVPGLKIEDGSLE